MSTTPGITHICTRPGCAKRSVARRLCAAPYQAAWKAGELGQHQKQPPRVRARTICLHRERWSDGRIADTIGCASKTVERIRGELGLEAFDQNELRDRGAA